jgi:hypothetical protein
VSWTIDAPKLKTLGALLLQNAAHIEDITLSLGSPQNPDGDTDIQINDLLGALNAMPGSRGHLFLNLKKVTLFGLVLMPGTKELLDALNLTKLEYLKLHDCCGTPALLDLLAALPEKMHLTAFELDYTNVFPEQRQMAPICRFLASFRELKDLFIQHPPHWSMDERFWSAVTSHKTTLKRLVVHQTDFENVRRRFINEVKPQMEFLATHKQIQTVGIRLDSASLVRANLCRTSNGIYRVLIEPAGHH